MYISDDDYAMLRKGNVPSDPELLHRMYIGGKDWIEDFKEYYLYNFVGKGYGGKVKFVVGPKGCGKTHSVRLLEDYAREIGYETCYISINKLNKKMIDMMSFYKEILSKINKEKIIEGICKKVGADLDYADKYEGDGQILSIMLNYGEGYSRDGVKREIRKSIGSIVKKLDALPSFVTFCFQACKARMIDDDNEILQILLNWLSGDVLNFKEKQQIAIFDKLQTQNSRVWFNSFLKLLNLAGIRGLFVVIDDLESIVNKGVDNNGSYTTNNLKDLYELIRQFVDDTEHMNNFVVFFVGRNELLENEKRGLKSYEALRMRIQTGIVQKNFFNSYADMIDFNQWIIKKDELFYNEIRSNLKKIFEESGYKFNYKTPISSEVFNKNIRSAIIEVSNMMEKGEINE